MNCLSPFPARRHFDSWLELYLYNRFVASLSRQAVPAAMHEGKSPPHCDEWVLQALWNERRLLDRAPLRTDDGIPVEIVHPGNWNLAAGPDFSDAVLRIDGQLRRGAVEVHREAADWVRHGHQHDPRYRSVILHVVWQTAPTSPSHPLPPSLSMRRHLPALWGNLLEEYTAADYPYARKFPPGQCALHTAELPDATVRDFLAAAGLQRFREKSRRILDRALTAGFAQTAYEKFFDALGYRVNREPFRELARALPLARIRDLACPLTRLAALMGSAGFLPDPTRGRRPVESSIRPLNRQLWDLWWRLGLEPLCLGWQSCGTRPANRPERRLPAACALLEKWNWRPVAAWSRELAAAESCNRFLKCLESLFDIQPPAEFVQAMRLTGGHSLKLGRSRSLDMAANLVLPLLHAKARQEQDRPQQERLEGLFLTLPRLQDNSVLRRICHRLLVPASRRRAIVAGAAQQQGLLAVARDFCQNVGGQCPSCRLNNPAIFEKGLVQG